MNNFDISLELNKKLLARFKQIYFTQETDESMRHNTVTIIQTNRDNMQSYQVIMPNCDKKRKRKHARNIERYLKLHSTHLISSHCHSHHEVFNDDDISKVVNDEFYPPEICIQLMLKLCYTYVVVHFIPNIYIYIRIGEKKTLYYMYNIFKRKNMCFCVY